VEYTKSIDCTVNNDCPVRQKDHNRNDRYAGDDGACPSVVLRPADRDLVPGRGNSVDNAGSGQIKSRSVCVVTRIYVVSADGRIYKRDVGRTKFHSDTDGGRN